MKKITILVPDDIDRIIIDCLNEDFRMPYQKIANKTGLTRQAVSRRIRKLKEKGLKWKFRI